jgi:hypothetical protein
MKLKFTQKNSDKDLPQIERPDIYEDEKYCRWRRILIFIGLPIIIMSISILAFNCPNLPLSSFMWSSALSLISYFIVISMMKEGTKFFWLTYLYTFAIYGLLTAFGFPTFLEGLPIISDYDNLLFHLSLLALPISYTVYNLHYQWREHNRCAIKKCPETLSKRNIQFKTKKKKKEAPQHLRKKKRLFSLSKSKKLNSLNFIEPAVYGSIRAKLTLWGLPLLTLILILTASFVTIENGSRFVTASAMAIGCFLFLVSMVRPDSKRFWIIFFLCLIFGTPLTLSPPSFLPNSSLVQVTILSMTFLGTALIYRWKIGTKV